jgi:hypothetical protein
MNLDQLNYAISRFSKLPDNSGVAVPVACSILGRSDVSIWRDVNAGRLESFKIGRSRRILVGSIRKVLAGGSK